MALPDIPELTPTHTDDLANLVDWRYCFARDPVVIGTKTSRLQTTFRISCPDTDHMQEQERLSYLARFHDVLKMLGEDWCLDADWRHETARAYPESQWTQPTDWLVDEIRRMRFASEPRYESATYLTLNWAVPKGKRRWMRDLFLTKTTARSVSRALDNDISLFQKGATRFADLLATTLPYCGFLTRDEMATYLHDSTQWQRFRVRMPSYPDNLDWQLSAGEWYPAQPPIVQGQLVQPITFKSWHEELGIFLPEHLAQMPFPVRWHLRWAPMGVQAADTYLRKQEKQWAGSYKRLSGSLKMSAGVKGSDFAASRDLRTDAIAAGQGILDVQNEVLAGEEVLGMLMPTLLTWAPTQAQLDEQVRQLQGVLFQQGIVGDVEKAGASTAWLASLPGHVHLGTRAFPLRTQELTGLIPHTHVWAGPTEDRHLNGPPVLVASTDATPFRLVRHVGENGHLLVVGPTRSGKSGLVGLMNRQWFRYPKARLAIFDRDNAHKVSTILGGGKHYALGVLGSSAFHPLGRVDRLEEQQWAMTWLEAILVGEGMPPNAGYREQMLLALRRLAGMPPRHRTLSMFQQMWQVPQEWKLALTPFCKGGLFAYFDGEEDAFDLETHRVCFEMAALLNQPRAIAPALSYIFQRLETTWFTGDPVEIDVEEARWLLGMEQFLGNFEVWLKARAKMNVSVTIVCQEIYDMYRTTAWQAIQANVPTKIFLPNPEIYAATVRPFYDDMGLGEGEIAMLHRAQRLRDYLYKSPLGTRLFQVVLSEVERLLCAASTLEELDVLTRLVETTPAAELEQAWLRHWGHEEEAALLERLKQAERQPEVDVLPRLKSRDS